MQTLGNNTDHNCSTPYEENRIPLVVMYSIVIVVGMPANLITVYLTFRQIQRKNVLGIYLFSLSVCDLMYLSTLPLWAIYVDNGHVWHWSSLACKITGYLFFNNMYISIFLLCCVSLDRYVAVVYAVESRGLRKSKLALIITVVIVIIVALTHLPVFTMSEGDVDNMEQKRCFEPGQNSFMVTFFNYGRFLMGFLLPFCVLVFTNHAIFVNVKASAGLMERQKDKVRYLALAVILLFVVCFAPYHVILLVRAISYNLSLEECHFEKSVYTPYTISLGLSTINSAMNPVLYVLASDNIRKEIRRNLASLRSGSVAGHSTKNSSEVRNPKT
ncbi:probable G-protein coupled receptor 132 [Chanos chanos]|uniref:Probable G-protein coupled receptor 132 n=1 Tax=Chanos chanos TaxID=29144 RepID=A0A6J2WG26_CHACN|nr:probable G-protein coupled receptor 132 [Chanos chanos]